MIKLIYVISMMWLGLQSPVEDSKFAEPFDVTMLEKNRIMFTSGGASGLVTKKFCENTKIGFYGSYHVYNMYGPHEDAGHITIYKEGKMSDWKASDTNQKVLHIELNSPIVSVWDSIKIGLTKSKIDSFAKKYNAVNKSKSDTSCSYVLKNFQADFIFSNDTVKKLVVTRLCK
jgi:hypothetical protein